MIPGETHPGPSRCLNQHPSSAAQLLSPSQVAPSTPEIANPQFPVDFSVACYLPVSRRFLLTIIERKRRITHRNHPWGPQSHNATNPGGPNRIMRRTNRLSVGPSLILLAYSSPVALLATHWQRLAHLAWDRPC